MERFALTEQTAPTIEPVTTGDAKAHLRVDITDDNALIDALVASARRHIEAAMNRSLINTTWDLTLDGFPDTIILPRSPLSSVTSITYIDTAGASQTLATADYTVDTKSEPGRIVPAYNTVWPSTRDIVNAVTVRFVAGYGTTAASVPADIIVAVKMLTAHWYENREPVNVGNIVTPLPMAVDSLIAQQKVWSPYSF